MYNLCIGLLTFCDSKKNPKRTEIIKKCIDSLEKLNREDVYIYVWDNGSSQDIIDFLKSKNFIKEIYFSNNKFIDFVAMHKLSQISNKINSKYVCHLEDDRYFDTGDFLDDCFNFLEKEKDCGYLRISKYEFSKNEIYTKGGRNEDKNHSQRHYNQITKNKLKWENCGKIGNNHFYKNNWHWTNFTNICRREVFEKIIPYYDTKPLQPLEGELMRNYHKLGMKTGVLDNGKVIHLGDYKKHSLRINNNLLKKDLKVLSYKDMIKEVKETISERN